MLLVGAFAVCLVIGMAGGRSRIALWGWSGAVAAALTLVAVAWGYHYDAKKLPTWFEQRNELIRRLRTNKICLDMEAHPEHWRNAEFENPCIGYDSDDLRKEIADEQDVLDQWNRAIREREALLKHRETGAFWFLQRKFGQPY